MHQRAFGSMHTVSVLAVAVAHVLQAQLRKLVYFLLISSGGDWERGVQCGGHAVLFFETGALGEGQVTVGGLGLIKEEFGMDSQGSNLELAVFTLTYHLHQIIVNYYMNRIMNMRTLKLKYCGLWSIIIIIEKWSLSTFSFWQNETFYNNVQDLDLIGIGYLKLLYILNSDNSFIKDQFNPNLTLISETFHGPYSSQKIRRQTRVFWPRRCPLIKN